MRPLIRDGYVALEPGAGGIVLSNLWHLRVMTSLRNVMQVVGGYEGPALPQGEYFGLGLLIVVGLLLQMLTLLLTRPLAFVGFFSWAVRWSPPECCSFSTPLSRTICRNFVRDEDYLDVAGN